jgi:serine/threonine-protein kinase
MDPQHTQPILNQTTRLQPAADAAPAATRDHWLGRTVGDFQVEELLGHGGMGTVYKARQLSLGRPVALKFLQSGRSLGPEAVLRFEAEARIAAQLNHSNVVHIYALGTFEDAPFIAMELVPGKNLGQILADRLEQTTGPLPLADCLNIMRQACLGLQAAAELGLVHRDIKPDNLMITEKGLVKVADFGLARSTKTEAVRLTQSGATLGTPLYMSPEQVQGLDVAAPSDIYSLGMTFYHLLTGRPPLLADSPYAVAMKQVTERPPAVRLLRSECPTDLSDLIDWMIEKRVDARPQSVDQVLEALARHELGLKFHTPRAGADAAPAAISRLPVEQAFPSVSFSRRGLVYWLGGTVLSSLAALVSGRVQARRRELAQQAAPAPWPPALGMADWKRIARQKSADWQYRFAQIQATEEDQVAAWLAVPGYFDGDEDWAWRAYVQLTGDLVRHTDRTRLQILQQSLVGLNRGIQFGSLQNVIQGTLDGMDGNEISLLENLHPMVRDAMDPNLAELILTVLAQYRQRIGRDRAVPVRLEKLQSQILEILRVDPKSA